MSSWSTLCYSFFSPWYRPFGKGVMKNIHKRGSIYCVVTAVKIRVLCIASWVLIVDNATINWGSWAIQNKTWLRSQRFEISAHWCRIWFYNAVESHRETCILIVLGRHNGLSTTHFSCIVVARASKIYLRLLVAANFASKARVLMLSSPPWLKLVGWGLRKRDVPCDHSCRSDALSISCQEYAVVLYSEGHRE